jgi:hypothetical protein
LWLLRSASVPSEFLLSLRIQKGILAAIRRNGLGCKVMAGSSRRFCFETQSRYQGRDQWLQPRWRTQIWWRS